MYICDIVYVLARIQLFHNSYMCICGAMEQKMRGLQLGCMKSTTWSFLLRIGDKGVQQALQVGMVEVSRWWYGNNSGLDCM